MAEWWAAMPLMKQIFYFFAVPATAVLLIQTFLAVTGLGEGPGDVNMDGQLGGDTGGMEGMEGAEAGEEFFLGDFRFFTISGMVAFFAVFGWTGAALTGRLPGILVFLLATAFGLGAMFLVALLFYSMTKLQASGNLQIKNAVGQVGEVYIPIPEAGKGRGKVMVTIQGRLTEVEAVTDEGDRLGTGTLVQVVSVLGNNEVMVRKMGGN
ncbi:hypothetical protein [Anaerotalea alkaliphila]|uniref:NfeD-like C-terminal domain-containing protein n=1 Tax=Anaerotalea alkaliphila TaxID=2662126 RepID=A0A7X5HXF6_9FIRM|nr:hypothetical protein [Anaerotalea alkaliphila]NDL68393.1 hypothetical protein [Anaerotalea alkaliphila]